MLVHVGSGDFVVYSVETGGEMGLINERMQPSTDNGVKVISQGNNASTRQIPLPLYLFFAKNHVQTFVSTEHLP